MKEALHQPRMAARYARLRVAAPASCLLALIANGCALTQKKATIPWKTAVLVRPVLPQPLAFSPDPDESVLDFDLEIPAPLAVVRMVPARPRTVAPAASSAAPERHDSPQIVPDLSPQQSSSFQRETEQSLGVAERNLAAAAGKQLNPTQTDLVSKIRGFIGDAREAGRTGDWSRARDLARKAQVLSDELAASLLGP